MWVKICGFTRAEDAESAIEAGADALGFVFEPRSKRHLPHHSGWQSWVAHLETTRVLVLADPAQLPADWHLFHAIQLTLPDGFTPEDAQRLLPPLPLWLAIRVGNLTPPAPLSASREGRETQGDSPSPFTERGQGGEVLFVKTLLDLWSPYVDRFFLDAYHPTLPGGTGEPIDWQLAAEIVQTSPHPVVLAGGLKPETVAEAIRIVRPFGVDVSSGVESAPGIKDPERIRQFIHNAREASGG